MIAALPETATLLIWGAVLLMMVLDLPVLIYVAVMEKRRPSPPKGAEPPRALSLLLLWLVCLALAAGVLFATVLGNLYGALRLAALAFLPLLGLVLWLSVMRLKPGVLASRNEEASGN